jgi:glycine/serine hydroxymethyltransferase
MDEADMRSIGGWMADVLEAPTDEAVRRRVREQVRELTTRRPLYADWREARLEAVPPPMT